MADREGACGLVFALQTSSGGDSHNGSYEHFGFDDGHSHQWGREDAHTTMQWSIINEMKVRNLIEWINEIMYI